MSSPTSRTNWPHRPEELAQLVADDGRLWPYWSSITAVAIALAESAGNALAMPAVIHDPASPAYLSVDVGLWQMNSYWQQHRYTRISELLDPATNCRLAVDLALTGRHNTPWRPDWSYWTAYKAGQAWEHIPRSRDAVNHVRAERGEHAL